jgi:galactose mutarotase-like enzyme
MQEIQLSNEKLEIKISTHGAELRSIRRKDTDTEYLWNADPKYWGRSSPVLFPFVGSIRNKTYRYLGQTYTMGQHGFARDMDFEVIESAASEQKESATAGTQNEAWFALESTDETYQNYPFRFRLEIGYRLEGSSVTVMWKVKNIDEKEIYFSIGAHPAFFCPVHEGEKQTDCYIGFWNPQGEKMQKFDSTVMKIEEGLVLNETAPYLLEDGLLPITEHLFDCNTLILEHGQAGRVAFLDSSKQEFLAVEFDAPVVGIWSPTGKQAPFICIEPWYGRCDNAAFDGELKDREWGNTLEPGQEFHAEYKIILICSEV